ncbi:hypothetical protein PR048_002191 [Dryococelus australis]|uniref:Uncharacterized protein n=1 Tax=Dryococelus australis TaxID=614101 RepID=A0ABQ9IL08_9NEOP|nr:hypothetical protein PR048_002191 [Dryococelus australis]
MRFFRKPQHEKDPAPKETSDIDTRDIICWKTFQVHEGKMDNTVVRWSEKSHAGDQCLKDEEGGELWSRVDCDVLEAFVVAKQCITVRKIAPTYQPLLMVSRGTRADEINAFLKRESLWPSVNVLKLAKNMRVHLSGEVCTGLFSDHLLKLRNCEYKTDSMIAIPDKLCTIVTTVQEPIAKIDPDVSEIQASL